MTDHWSIKSKHSCGVCISRLASYHQVVTRDMISCWCLVGTFMNQIIWETEDDTAVLTVSSTASWGVKLLHSVASSYYIQCESLLCKLIALCVQCMYRNMHAMHNDDVIVLESNEQKYLGLLLHYFFRENNSYCQLPLNDLAVALY